MEQCIFYYLKHFGFELNGGLSYNRSLETSLKSVYSGHP